MEAPSRRAVPWWAVEVGQPSDPGREPSRDAGGTVPGAEPLPVTTQARHDPGAEGVTRRPAGPSDLALAAFAERLRPALERTTHLAYGASVVAAYVCVAALVTTLWVARDQLFKGGTDADSAERIADGTAEKPFVTRLLVPVATGLPFRLLHPTEREALAHQLIARYPRLREVQRFCRVSDRFLPQLIVILLVDFAGLLGFMVVLRALFARLHESEPLARDGIGLLGALLVPLTFTPGAGRLVYDFPGLFLFSLALLLLERRRWGWLYLVVVVGLLNKETMALIAVPFAVTMWGKLKLRPYALHLAGLVSLGVGFRIALLWLFRQSKGDPIEWHWNDNLGRMWESGLLGNLPMVAAAILVSLLVWGRAATKPAFVRQSLLTVIPMTALYLAGGWWGEIRVFYEVFGVLVLAGYHTLLELAGAPFAVRERLPGGASPPPGPPLLRLWLHAGLLAALAVVSVGICLRRLELFGF